MTRPRALGALALTLPIWFALPFFGCDSRFYFDESTPAGSGGDTTQAGTFTVAGAATAGGGVAGGGAAGSGGTRAESGATSQAGGGAAPVGCGGPKPCPGTLRCVDEQCVECAADADCTVEPSKRCNLDRHRCVGCLVAADCAQGLACDALAGHCLPKCHEEVDCPEDAHGCDEQRSVCYQCDEDRECATSPLGHLCANDGSGCVECRKDADCPGRHCDSLNGRCVDCARAADCSSAWCDVAAGTCFPP